MEHITITLTPSQSKMVSYNLQAVAFKQGRKEIARTEQTEDGRWSNCRNNFAFSTSETKERAIELMKRHLESCLAPFADKEITFVNK